MVIIISPARDRLPMNVSSTTFTKSKTTLPVDLSGMMGWTLRMRANVNITSPASIKTPCGFSFR